MAVMTVALYAVLFFLSRDVPRTIQAGVGRAGDRPGAARRRSRSSICNLAVVTAVALFFSTYSSPMLSARLHARRLRRRAVQRRSEALRSRSSIRRRPIAVAKACYYVLPDFAKFDVKLAVVHGLPVSGRIPGDHLGLRGALRRGAPLRRDGDLLAERLQMTRRASAAGRRPAVRSRRGAVALHAAQDRWPAPTVDAPGLLYVRSPAAAKKRRPRLRCARGGRLLDPRAAAFRRRASLAARARAHLRAAVPAARSDDDAGSVLQHRLSLRRDLPRRAVSRADPAGPIWPIALLQKGLAAQPRQVAVHAWTSDSSTTGTFATTRRPAPRFSAPRSMPDAPAWLRPLAAVTLARRWTPRGVADAVAAARAVRGGVAARRGRAAAAQLDAMDAIDSLQALVQASARRTRASRHLGTSAAARVLPASRSIRRARRSPSIRRPATSPWRASRSCFPCQASSRRHADGAATGLRRSIRDRSSAACASAAF